MLQYTRGEGIFQPSIRQFSLFCPCQFLLEVFIMKEYRVGIIGCTGMVGQRFVTLM